MGAPPVAAGRGRSPLEPPAGLFARIEARLEPKQVAPDKSSSCNSACGAGATSPAAASAVAACLLVVIGVREMVRPQVPSSYVAVFQKDDVSPAFLLSVDLATRTLSIRMVAAERQPGKSYQLWIATEQSGGVPQSLGLIEDRSDITRTVLTSLRSVRGADGNLRRQPGAGRRIADRQADRAGAARETYSRAQVIRPPAESRPAWRHARAGGHPRQTIVLRGLAWISAFAEMTCGDVVTSGLRPSYISVQLIRSGDPGRSSCVATSTMPGGAFAGRREAGRPRRPLAVIPRHDWPLLDGPLDGLERRQRTGATLVEIDDGLWIVTPKLELGRCQNGLPERPRAHGCELRAAQRSPAPSAGT